MARRRRPSVDRDWQQAATASALLSILFPDHRTPETPGVRRKLRLVLCGAARTVWDRLPHDDLRRAVEVAERFADGLATKRELDSAQRKANRLCVNAVTASGQVEITRRTIAWDQYAVHQYAGTAALLVQLACGRSVTVVGTAGDVLLVPAQLAAPMTLWVTAVRIGWHRIEVGPDPAAAVVRDIFGHPEPPRFPAAWKSPTVLALAEGIAADAGFDRLPVLADALEDAGCADERVLTHCRGPGPHWRGCWVVDSVLGK